VESLFDILQKIDDVNFVWIEVVEGLRTAIARIEELQARTPGEYVVFDQRTQQVVAQRKSRATRA
jgi:hypothetical protein